MASWTPETIGTPANLRRGTLRQWAADIAHLTGSGGICRADGSQWSRHATLVLRGCAACDWNCGVSIAATLGPKTTAATPVICIS